MRNYQTRAFPMIFAGVEAIPRLHPYGPGTRRYGPRGPFVPASINRHTGKPHEHQREIARRLRQAAKRG